MKLKLDFANGLLTQMDKMNVEIIRCQNLLKKEKDEKKIIALKKKIASYNKMLTERESELNEKFSYLNL